MTFFLLLFIFFLGTSVTQVQAYNALDYFNTDSELIYDTTQILTDIIEFNEFKRKNNITGPIEITNYIPGIIKVDTKLKLSYREPIDANLQFYSDLGENGTFMHFNDSELIFVNRATGMNGDKFMSIFIPTDGMQNFLEKDIGNKKNAQLDISELFQIVYQIGSESVPSTFLLIGINYEQFTHDDRDSSVSIYDITSGVNLDYPNGSLIDIDDIISFTEIGGIVTSRFLKMSFYNSTDLLSTASYSMSLVKSINVDLLSFREMIFDPLPINIPLVLYLFAIILIRKNLKKTALAL